MLLFPTYLVSEGIHVIIHSCGKYTPWCYLNYPCINVLPIEWTSKTTDDQNVNPQNEQIKWGSSISLNAVLFQIKLLLILAKELKCDLYLDSQVNMKRPRIRTSLDSVFCNVLSLDILEWNQYRNFTQT